MIRISTGLRAALLTDFGLRAMMNYGQIRVFGGVQPPSASLAPSATLLANITTNGTPFQPNTYNGGLQVGLVEEGGLGPIGIWRMKGVATGNAVWWRWTWNAPDDDTDSQFYPRMDGAVGESLFLTADAITAATNVIISNFNVNLKE
jgi:hypothetical protein